MGYMLETPMLGLAKAIFKRDFKSQFRRTLFGPLLAFLITCSFVIENLFSIPGIGSEFVNSVTNRDYTLIMGLTIFMGFLVIAMNLLSDVVSAWVDPRIKLDK